MLITTRYVHFARLAFWLSLVALTILCSAGRTYCEPSMTAASNRIINDLEQGNYKAFDQDISHGGLLVVRREAVWNHSSPFKELPANFYPGGRADSLSFNGMTGAIWTESELSFQKPTLSDPDYLLILKQFRGIVLTSADVYPTGINASHRAVDEFDERHLGPCISGKVCAGTAWWFYLDIEHGKWKVWRMELWQH